MHLEFDTNYIKKDIFYIYTVFKGWGFSSNQINNNLTGRKTKNIIETISPYEIISPQPKN